MTSVLSFSQTLLISKPALECIDNSGVCKFTECSLYSPNQINAEITEKDMADLKLFLVTVFDMLVSFDTGPLLNWETIQRDVFTYVCCNFIAAAMLL